MKRSVIVLAAAALVVALFAAPRPASAGSSWIAGADFSVGGIHFSLGLHQPSRYGYGYRPHYFYRTQHRLDYRGLKCGSACYVRDRVYYHDRYCPVVRHHFGLHHVDPYYAWGYVAPGYGYDARGYGPPRYYDDHHRSYGRYKDRHHGHHGRRHDRGHRHGPSCDHRR